MLACPADKITQTVDRGQPCRKDAMGARKVTHGPSFVFTLDVA